MQVCGRLWSVISSKVRQTRQQQRGRQRKSPRPRSNRQLAYLPPPLPPVGPTNGSQGKAHRPVLQKLWNQKNIVRETFSFQRAHFPVDIFHFSAAIFANLRKDLTFLHNCIFCIFAISIFYDSHRPRTGHWQLLRRLITDLPPVTRGARARPAYQPPLWPQ